MQRCIQRRIKMDSRRKKDNLEGSKKNRLDLIQKKTPHGSTSRSPSKANGASEAEDVYK